MVRPATCVLFFATVFFATAAAGSDRLYESAAHKFEIIESGHAKPGSVITFTQAEINAWAAVVVPQTVPDGVRSPRVDLGSGTAAGSALIDFLKVRQDHGASTNWLISRLIEGERPVRVSVRLTSGGGRCTVDLTRLEISNVAVNESVLDFLVRNFFMPLYPDAKIGQPFELGFNIDRLDVTPAEVRVTMKSSR